jgi:hypothetical protein
MKSAVSFLLFGQVRRFIPWGIPRGGYPHLSVNRLCPTVVEGQFTYSVFKVPIRLGVELFGSFPLALL